MTKATNLLFICSKNKWRSPTAEKIWNEVPNFKARSAGLSPKAKKVVSLTDIRWADYIFVMEKKHKMRLMNKFDKFLFQKPIYVLDIPDNYQFMNADLINILREKISAYFRMNIG